MKFFLHSLSRGALRVIKGTKHGSDQILKVEVLCKAIGHTAMYEEFKVNGRPL